MSPWWAWIPSRPGSSRTFFGPTSDNGGTVFLSSHTLEVVEVLCDVLAIIHEGTVIAGGTMEELRSQAQAGEADLEEIFLKVTGGEEVADIVVASPCDGRVEVLDD